MLTQVRKKTMEISLLTDIGQKRSNNQDFVNKFVNQAGVTLVVVADGMGGHRAGNIASEMSVTDLGRDWINTDFRELSQIRDWMIAAIDAENRKIYELGQNEEYKGMGTTIEVLAFVDNAVIFAHVGDSRIALIRNGYVAFVYLPAGKCISALWGGCYLNRCITFIGTTARCRSAACSINGQGSCFFFKTYMK